MSRSFLMKKRIVYLNVNPIPRYSTCKVPGEMESRCSRPSPGMSLIPFLDPSSWRGMGNYKKYINKCEELLAYLNTWQRRHFYRLTSEGF